MKENKIRYASYGFTWKPYVISWVFCLKIEEEKDIFPHLCSLGFEYKMTRYRGEYMYVTVFSYLEQSVPSEYYFSFFFFCRITAILSALSFVIKTTK